MVAIAHHQPTAGLIPLVGQLGYVLTHFGFQSRGEHPPRTLPDDVVQQGSGLGGAIGVDYAEHGRAFPARATNAGLLGDLESITWEGTPSALRETSQPRPIHRF